jgi:hypothetical protein
VRDRRVAQRDTGYARRFGDDKYPGWTHARRSIREPRLPDWSRWERDYRRRQRPIARRYAWLIVLAAAATWLVVGYLLVTAPRPAAVIPLVGTSESPPSAGAGSATLDETGQRPTRAPAPIGVLELRGSELGARPAVRTGHAPPAVAQPSGAVNSEISGVATWYCNADPRWPISRCPRGHGVDEFVAAINPTVVDLALGTSVVVEYQGRRVAVTIVDRCSPCEATIDLTRIAFSAIADAGDGEIDVTLEWGDAVPLPPTDGDQHGQDPAEHPDDERMRLEDHG